MLLSAVSVLVVAQSSSEIPEGLMNNPVLNVAETGTDSCGRDGRYLLLCKRKDKCHGRTADRHKKDLSQKSQ